MSYDIEPNGDRKRPARKEHRGQVDLFGARKFDGATYEPAHDEARLLTQQGKVHEAMLSGSWMTIGEIHAQAGGSEAGISARIRDLRKERWGSNVIERRRRGEEGAGLFEYRMVL